MGEEIVNYNSIITIIIPNLNGKRFLRICLDSIMQQTFQDIFVTVVDNGSMVTVLEKRKSKNDCWFHSAWEFL